MWQPHDTVGPCDRPTKLRAQEERHERRVAIEAVLKEHKELSLYDLAAKLDMRTRVVRTTLSAFTSYFVVNPPGPGHSAHKVRVRRHPHLETP